MHIYRRPRSPYYWTAYYLPSPAGAVLVRKSTKEKLLRKAQTEAAKLREADLRAAGADDDTARETLRILAEAQGKATAGELTIAAARVMLLELAKAGGTGEIRLWTVREWVNEWLAARLPVTAATTAAAYKTHTTRFLETLGPKADARIETLEAGDFRKFRDATRKGRAAKTANLGLKIMRSCFQAAVKEGVLLANPAASVETLPETDSVTREPFTWSEVENILSACPDDEWKALVLLGALAGLRLGDAARLKLGNVDFKAGTISLVAQKKARKGKAFTVPLHPRLSKALAALPRPISASLPLLPSLAPLAIAGRSGLSLQFSRILEAAAKANKPKTPEDPDWQGGTRGRSFHSLRHTFVSLLANSGVDSETRRLLSDHATESAHRIYTHHEIETLRAAVNKIGAAAGQSGA
jgi:integrase